LIYPYDQSSNKTCKTTVFLFKVKGLPGFQKKPARFLALAIQNFLTFLIVAEGGTRTYTGFGPNGFWVHGAESTSRKPL